MTVDFVLTSPLINDAAAADAARRLVAADGALLTNGWQLQLWLPRIGDELLLRLLKEHIEDADPADYAECLSPFEGGLRLEAGGVVIEPQCCCGLGDAEDWADLLLHQPADWQRVWVGHPWVYARFDEDWVYFSEYGDAGGETPAGPLTVLLQLPRAEFVAALRSALTALTAFYHQLRRVVLATPAFENPAGLVAALTSQYFNAD
jgi:hypothetical protein